MTTNIENIYCDSEGRLLIELFWRDPFGDLTLPREQSATIVRTELAFNSAVPAYEIGMFRGELALCAPLPCYSTIERRTMT